VDVGICFGKGIGVGFHWQMLIHFKKLTWFKAYPELQRTSQKSGGRPDVFFLDIASGNRFWSHQPSSFGGPKNGKPTCCVRNRFP
jgi:hypothetical protein